ncbi:MAG: tRNA adenosine(34) deaminase TadA [Ignavibacteriaceae bacterium]|nr:tRNA adenosine(34) deaminase TadA [Ignavibacteriaceae bacterium]
MIFSEEKYRFMFAALQEAEKALEENEVPVGAVVVKDNRIIGRGYNQVERLKDATAHAEMIALTAAANHIGNWRLSECSIYVTLEPCIMCTGALLASRIKELYFSIFDPKFGACGSIYNLAEDGKTNHKINVYSGIYSEESKKLLQDFFDNLKNKNPLKFSPPTA